jgi:hypothetical protein
VSVTGRAKQVVVYAVVVGDSARGDDAVSDG